MKGHPVSIVVPVENESEHGFELNRAALEDILLRDEIKDKYVVVISISGTFRKGKSFMLDFFLRYLQSEDKEDWLGDPESPLTGFHWRSGCERDTVGILMWSEPFVVRIDEHREVAVVLMDTQGAFDSDSTVKDCATVFALSTMLSSNHIYNLSLNLHEDDLQHLQLFTEYGRLALERSDHKPFQKLLFLIRDWAYPYDNAYGAVGGCKLLEKRLQITEKQHPELQSLRRHIRDCFEDVECYLMPHPGLKVATNPQFDGRLNDIEENFVQELRSLVPSILAPENLVVKRISNVEIKAKELINFFDAYINIYQGSELPEPKTMLQATAEANNLSAVSESRELYINLMEAVCGGKCPYISSKMVADNHAAALTQCVETFRSRIKMGGEQFSEIYLAQLKREISDRFEHYKLANESKNIFKSAKTPAVLVILIFVLYVLSTVFSLLSLTQISFLCTMFMFLLATCLFMWIYSRFSGDYSELALNIDAYVEIFWVQYWKPLYNLMYFDESPRIAIPSIPGSAPSKGGLASR